MRVLLIMPPFERLMGINFSYFPIGLGYLAACLKETGTDVKIYNVENPSKNENLPEANNRLFLSKHDNYIQSLRDDNHAVWHEVRKVLEEFRPDVVGISVTTAKVTSAYKISSLCKKINPSCHVVWGGPHPTILPEQTLGYEGIDFVVRGEGEKTLAEFIQAINSSSPNLSRIKGLSYKKNGAIVHNELRPYIENLDTLPFPAKDEVLYPERYLPWDMGVMITSRGCPFKCTYCGARNIWGKKTRYRTAANVIEEIKYVAKNYHTKQIIYWDDTFNLNRKRVLDL